MTEPDSLQIYYASDQSPRSITTSQETIDTRHTGPASLSDSNLEKSEFLKPGSFESTIGTTRTIQFTPLGLFLLRY